MNHEGGNFFSSDFILVKLNQAMPDRKHNVMMRNILCCPELITALLFLMSTKLKH